MDIRRVVNIRFSDPPKFSSGYLINDTLVLTAAHVAVGRAEGAPCLIRNLSQTERAGTLKWVSGQYDAALVELDQPGGFGELGPAPLFGRANQQNQKEYACLSMGFPRATRINEVRQDFTLKGSAFVSFLSSSFDISPATAIPNSAEGWLGFSGAAVFNGPLLAAIVASVPEDFSGGVVRAIPIAQLLQDPAFAACVSPDHPPESLVKTMRPADYYAELSETLGLHYCFVDRKAQVDQVMQVLSLSRARPAADAHGFLVRARDVDQPGLLMRRLSQLQEIMRLVGDTAAERTIVPMEWPRSQRIVDPEGAFRDLKAQLASLLDLPEEVAGDPAALRQAFEQRGQAAAICWTLIYVMCGEGHGRLLDLWTQFCCEASGGRMPLLWFACVLLPTAQVQQPSSTDYLLSGPATQPDAKMGEVMRALSETGRLVELDPLGDIYLEVDLDPWLDRVWRTRPDWGDDDRTDLRTRIGNAIDVPTLPLLPFTKAVYASLGLLR
jgi:hypothetical protein